MMMYYGHALTELFSFVDLGAHSKFLSMYQYCRSYNYSSFGADYRVTLMFIKQFLLAQKGG